MPAKTLLSAISLAIGWTPTSFIFGLACTSFLDQTIHLGQYRNFNMLNMNDKKIICLAVDDEPPALEVLKKFITSVHTLKLAGICSDAIEAMNFLQSNPVDLIFLDIKM